jgi:hypothetical protein
MVKRVVTFKPASIKNVIFTYEGGIEIILTPRQYSPDDDALDMSVKDTEDGNIVNIGFDKEELADFIDSLNAIYKEMR